MLDSMFDPAQIAPGKIRPLSRKEYDRMVELGMFQRERIELLRGMLVTMSPIGWLHARVTSWFTEQLIRQLDPSFEVRPQGSFAAGEWSEPEPDVAVAQKDYSLRDLPSELLLLVEVADSSLQYDRTVKVGVYAEANVPEYWIVDVNTATVEVHTKPSGDSYAQVQVLRDGDVLRPALLPTVAIAVSEMPR
jgi:Uma2 family endonuclease